jgi:heme oxygenase
MHRELPDRSLVSGAALSSTRQERPATAINGLVRQALKSATASLHDRLHQAALFQDLLNGLLSIDRYQVLLASLHAIYQPLEERLVCALSQSANLGALGTYQRRTPLLARDLADLESVGPVAVIARTPPRIPDIDRDCQALGALYVIEGSSMGARLMARKLDSLLPQDHARARRYFDVTALQSAQRWAAVCAVIDTFEERSLETQEMIDVACQTFALFSHMLNDDDVAVIYADGAVGC